MVCYHKNGKIHLETIHDYDQYRWREGLICIKSAKFKDIMKTFTKYFDGIVEDKGASEPVDEDLKTVCTSLRDSLRVILFP